MLEKIAMRYKPEQTGYSEDPTHPYNAVRVVFYGNEEESDSHCNQQSIHVVPAVGKEVFRANCENPYY